MKYAQQFRMLFALIILSLLLNACSLFKKKCDCPDHRRAKRVAVLGDNLLISQT
jgi:hypothetical protein